MPTDLGRRFEPSFRGLPPGMAREDYLIWKRFVDTFAPAAEAFYFNVRLGSGNPGNGQADPSLQRMWRMITQKRADVVADLRTGWVIIELRSHATASAIGRLLQYLDLWGQDPPDDRPVSGWLISDLRDADTERLAFKVGIQYTIV